MARTVIAAMKDADTKATTYKEDSKALTAFFLSDERVELALATALHKAPMLYDLPYVSLPCSHDAGTVPEDGPCLQLARKLLDEVWWS